MTGQHIPVLLEEAVDALAVRAQGMYIDATFGRGGHAQKILERLGTEGRLVAFDKDPAAARAAAARFGQDARFEFFRGSFARMAEVVGSQGEAAGILMDLGVSSPQLDTAERGFSFSRSGPLDMRMDSETGMTAAVWLAQAAEREIADVLWRLGEERYSRRIARAIVAARKQQALGSTDELRALITQVVPKREPGKDPATRTFQAIRIHINNELADLQAGLEEALQVLAPQGRLVVISFHSLEDRIVKRFMRAHALPPALPRRLPITQDQAAPELRILGKPVRASNIEVAANPRARSAIMRVAEKRP